MLQVGDSTYLTVGSLANHKSLVIFQRLELWLPPLWFRTR